MNMQGLKVDIFETLPRLPKLVLKGHNETKRTGRIDWIGLGGFLGFPNREGERDSSK